MTWDLPAGWTWRALSELMTIIRVQVSPDAIEECDTFVGLEHIQSGTGACNGVPASRAQIRSNKFRFEPGDLLFGKLRPNLRKVAVVDFQGVCSTDILPFRPHIPAAAHLIALQMRSEPFTAMVMRLIGGANLPRVGAKDLISLSLPVPPAHERDWFYAASRSVSALRERQQKMQLAVTDASLAVTAAALGLSDKSFSNRACDSSR